ncbi:hypothetical protein K227x_43390 [Rubripirellula lacrimiformis]|uniref:Uncharacterized protein n=1 Tax=Rubripirellula lacrimiformis TaxID=1930273 RepID=A0A517NFP3_9BACT|nr:hypothetical protein [Rubripirellula lacrimiformis]QDT05933.1 hypothetical protein K227x_43390 [Rubripirellula lacrimiformis]
MTVSNCPRCEEPFRMPLDPANAELPDGAFGECPWCHETFLMKELIQSLPPVLAIKSKDGTPIQSLVGGAVAVVASGLPTDSDDEFGPMIVDDDDLGLASGQESNPNETVTNETWASSSPDAMESLEIDEVETYPDASSLNQPGADDPVAFGEMPSHDIGSFEAESSETDSDDIHPEYNLAPVADQWGGSDREEVAPMRVSTPARRAPKKSAPWKTAVGVVVGGALALPIADGILTLAGRESILGIWPSKSSNSATARVRASQPMPMSNSPANNQMDTAATDEPPTTAPAGRELAMPDVAGGPTTDESAAQVLGELGMPDPDATAPAVDDAPATAPNPQDSSFAENPTADPETSFADPKAVEAMANDNSFDMPIGGGMGNEPATGQARINPEVEPEIRSIPDETAATPAAPSNDETAAAIDPPTSISNDDAGTAADASTTNALRDAADASAPTDSPKLAAAIADANQMLDQVIQSQDGDPQELRKSLARGYIMIAEVGSLATPDSAAAKELLARVRQPTLLSTYENASSRWFTHTSRTTDGILIVGRPSADVTGDRSQGGTITVGDGTVITVKGGANLPDAERVLALGRIVGDGADATVELTVAEPL